LEPDNSQQPVDGMHMTSSTLVRSSWHAQRRASGLRSRSAQLVSCSDLTALRSYRFFLGVTPRVWNRKQIGLLGADC